MRDHELMVLIYVVTGIMFFSWSMQYAPRSRQAFNTCFQYSRVVYALIMLVAITIWPLIAISMLYRFTFGTKEAKDEESDR